MTDIEQAAQMELASDEQEQQRQSEAVARVVTMLQQRLDISPEEASDLARIGVVCPMPGQEGQQGTLGHFLGGERGASMAELIIGGAAAAKETGELTAEAALERAIGSFALRDEDGSMVRVPAQDGSEKK
jgi:hypothetical protein